MTVRAVEIATTDEKHAADFTWVIDEGIFL